MEPGGESPVGDGEMDGNSSALGSERDVHTDEEAAVEEAVEVLGDDEREDNGDGPEEEEEEEEEAEEVEEEDEEDEDVVDVDDDDVIDVDAGADPEDAVPLLDAHGNALGEAGAVDDAQVDPSNNMLAGGATIVFGPADEEPALEDAAVVALVDSQGADKAVDADGVQETHQGTADVVAIDEIALGAQGSGADPGAADADVADAAAADASAGAGADIAGAADVGAADATIVLAAVPDTFASPESPSSPAAKSVSDSDDVMNADVELAPSAPVPGVFASAQHVAPTAKPSSPLHEQTPIASTELETEPAVIAHSERSAAPAAAAPISAPMETGTVSSPALDLEPEMDAKVTMSTPEIVVAVATVAAPAIASTELGASKETSAPSVPPDEPKAAPIPPIMAAAPKKDPSVMMPIPERTAPVATAAVSTTASAELYASKQTSAPLSAPAGSKAPLSPPAVVAAPEKKPSVSVPNPETSHRVAAAPASLSLSTEMDAGKQTSAPLAASGESRALQVAVTAAVAMDNDRSAVMSAPKIDARGTTAAVSSTPSTELDTGKQTAVPLAASGEPTATPFSAAVAEATGSDPSVMMSAPKSAAPVIAPDTSLTPSAVRDASNQTFAGFATPVEPITGLFPPTVVATSDMDTDAPISTPVKAAPATFIVASPTPSTGLEDSRKQTFAPFGAPVKPTTPLIPSAARAALEYDANVTMSTPGAAAGDAAAGGAAAASPVASTGLDDTSKKSFPPSGAPAKPAAAMFPPAVIAAPKKDSDVLMSTQEIPAPFAASAAPTLAQPTELDEESKQTSPPFSAPAKATVPALPTLAKVLEIPSAPSPLPAKPSTSPFANIAFGTASAAAVITSSPFGASTGFGSSVTSTRPHFGFGGGFGQSKPVSFSSPPTFQSLSPTAPVFVPGASAFGVKASVKSPVSSGFGIAGPQEPVTASVAASHPLGPTTVEPPALPYVPASAQVEPGPSTSTRSIPAPSQAAAEHTVPSASAQVSTQVSRGSGPLHSVTPAQAMQQSLAVLQTPRRNAAEERVFDNVSLSYVKSVAGRRGGTVAKKEGVYSIRLFSGGEGGSRMDFVRTDSSASGVWKSLPVAPGLIRCLRVKGRPNSLSVTRVGSSAPPVDSEVDPAKIVILLQSSEICNELAGAFRTAMQAGQYGSDAGTSALPQTPSALKTPAKSEALHRTAGSASKAPGPTGGVAKPSLAAQKSLLRQKLALLEQRKRKQNAKDEKGKSSGIQTISKAGSQQPAASNIVAGSNLARLGTVVSGTTAQAGGSLNNANSSLKDADSVMNIGPGISSKKDNGSTTGQPVSTSDPAAVNKRSASSSALTAEQGENKKAKVSFASIPGSKATAASFKPPTGAVGGTKFSPAAVAIAAPESRAPQQVTTQGKEAALAVSGSAQLAASHKPSDDSAQQKIDAITTTPAPEPPKVVSISQPSSNILQGAVAAAPAADAVETATVATDKTLSGNVAADVSRLQEANTVLLSELSRVKETLSTALDLSQKEHKVSEEARISLETELNAFRVEVQRLQNELTSVSTRKVDELKAATEQRSLLLSSIADALSILHRAPHSQGSRREPSLQTCRPWSAEDFFVRLGTFRPSTWAGFSEIGKIDPLVCAAHGWYNDGNNLLRSTDGAEICLDSSLFAHEKAYKEEVERIHGLVMGQGHKLLSGWLGTACPDSFTSLAGSGKMYNHEELQANADEFRRCAIQGLIAIAGFPSANSSPSLGDVGDDEATALAVYNWKMLRNDSGRVLLTCSWCTKQVVLHGLQPQGGHRFHCQKSHYEHCPLSVSPEGWRSNFETLQAQSSPMDVEKPAMVALESHSTV